MSDYKMYVNGERVQTPTGHHIVLDANMSRSEIHLVRPIPAEIPGTRGVERFPVALPEDATLELRQDGHHVGTFVEGGGIAVDALRAENERDQLHTLLKGLVEAESDPCSFDHHGCCQTHGWFGEPGECYTRQAREAVGLE